MKRMGVLSFQGDVYEHIFAIKKAIKNLGLSMVVNEIKTGDDMNDIDALVIPGGESTTIGKFISIYDMDDKIKEFAVEGKPILGTCAGMILLAKKGDSKNLLGIMNMEIKRNAFGRQRESFETDIDIDNIGKYHAVFIRAPVIKRVWGNCRLMAKLDNKDNKGVMARQDNIIALAFHPELTDDTRIQEYFLKMVVCEELTMKILKNIGMRKNWIYEVIVTTLYNKNPYAAPIGVWTEDFDTIKMCIYRNSTTLGNIIREREFAVNFVDDIGIFYKSLFNKNEIMYENSIVIDASVIKNSTASIELRVKEMVEKREGDGFFIEGEILSVQIRDKIKLINRAECLALESLIYATKINHLPENIKNIREILKENYRIIRKIAPNSEYENIMERLQGSLNLLD